MRRAWKVVFTDGTQWGTLAESRRRAARRARDTYPSKTIRWIKEAK